MLKHCCVARKYARTHARFPCILRYRADNYARIISILNVGLDQDAYTENLVNCGRPDMHKGPYLYDVWLYSSIGSKGPGFKLRCKVPSPGRSMRTFKVWPHGW